LPPSSTTSAPGGAPRSVPISANRPARTRMSAAPLPAIRPPRSRITRGATSGRVVFCELGLGTAGTSTRYRSAGRPLVRLAHQRSVARLPQRRRSARCPRLISSSRDCAPEPSRSGSCSRSLIGAQINLSGREGSCSYRDQVVLLIFGMRPVMRDAGGPLTMRWRQRFRSVRVWLCFQGRRCAQPWCQHQRATAVVSITTRPRRTRKAHAQVDASERQCQRPFISDVGHPVSPGGATAWCRLVRANAQ